MKPNRPTSVLCSKKPPVVPASALILLLLALVGGEARAGTFSLGDLVVVQVGDGSAALSSAATTVSLLEYNTGGGLIQSLSLPSVVSGLNQPLTLQGTATAEGFLALSTSGQYLTLAGYAATPGTAAPSSATPTTVNRVVARIGLDGTIDTTTALSDAYSGSAIRSAVSSDGTSIWTGGNAGSGLGSTAGARSTSFGTSTSVRLNPSSSNMRVVNIYDGQLYVSSSTGTFLGVSTVGTGLPTTADSAPLTALPGMPTTGTHSAYDFWFKDSSTLFVADDGSAANGGGIQKWTFDGTTWTLAYTLLNNGTTTTAVRGLAGTVDGSGNAVLFGTTGSALITVTDTGATATATTLATAPANTAFRGVEYLVPEPSAAGLLLLGLVALIRARKG